MKFTSDPALAPGLGHHGGIELCDSGTGDNRIHRAELFWIERDWDYGYTTMGSGIEHHYKYVDDPVSKGSTGMHNKEFHTWRIILDNKGVVQMWSVDGVDLTKYRGLSTGCATNTVVYPKIWSYSGSALMVDGVPQITQRSELYALERELDLIAPLFAAPYLPKVNECERLPDGSLKVNAVGNGKSQTFCPILGRGSQSGCFARRTCHF